MTIQELVEKICQKESDYQRMSQQEPNRRKAADHLKEAMNCFNAIMVINEILESEK